MLQLLERMDFFLQRTIIHPLLCLSCNLAWVKETTQCNQDCCTYLGVMVQGVGVLG